MMTNPLSPLPDHSQEFQTWEWAQIDPHFQALQSLPLQAGNANGWLAEWSRLLELLSESYWRLYVATTVDTADASAQENYARYLDQIYPPAQAANQALKEKFLASGLKPAGFELPLRNLRAESELFRAANLPLLAGEMKLATEYDQIIGAQTVAWEGQEVTLTQLQRVYQDTDRARRERAWRLAAARQLRDRAAINALWQRFMPLRGQLAANAGLPDYRAYRWRQMLRFDYTPDDAHSFHEAIAAVAVPAAQQLYERRRRALGVATLRPWDLEVDPFGRPPLTPFTSIQELEEKTNAIFDRVDPQLGHYFSAMRHAQLLDLDNRKNKAPGGYCTEFERVRQPFIFMNAVGVHDDVQTLLHEGGHAFHVFETAILPYSQQRQVPLEFAEVASMGMELLAAPYLTASAGGFYDEAEAARARIEILERIILFWPYMAVVDAFQHWVYTHHLAASDPKNCDAQWRSLWQRFMPGVDWSGLEDELVTGWQRKLHIHQNPFYYIEYGLAQLGALQVWRNSLSDQVGAVAAYRKGLALGGTATLPELYAAAGARFAFDAETLSQAVSLALRTIEDLSAKAA
jgi:oligoendopeptidase F